MIERHETFYREQLGLELDEPLPPRLVKVDEGFVKKYSHIGGPPINSTILLVLMAVAGCFDGPASKTEPVVSPSVRGRPKKSAALEVLESQA